jgi:DNA-binding NarL/FixJ family response regulator
MRTSEVSALVVVSDPVERNGVAACLEADHVRLAGLVPTAEKALVRLRPDGQDRADIPQVVLMDFRMHGLSGGTAVTAVREAAPGARVVVLSEHATAPVMLAVFGAGAHGLVIKDSDPTRLGEAVHAVVDGGIYVDPKVAPSLVELAKQGSRAKGPYGLTHQQLRVLEHLAEGMTNRQIAEQLVLGVETIKSHVRQIMIKVGVHNRAELARRAIEEGLV